MSDPDARINKIKLAVEIERDSGVSTGFVFLSAQARLSDLLNDSRNFLPFESHSGKFSAIGKSTIRAVTPLDQVEQTYEGDDPYRILGVSENAEMGEIKKAYLTLCTEHHPDRIKGMGLASEYVELANGRMVRINGAFQRITAMRGLDVQETNDFTGAAADAAARWEAERHAAEEEAERKAAARATERKAAAEEARNKAAAEAVERKAAAEEAERRAAERKAAAEEAYRKATAAEEAEEAEQAASKKEPEPAHEPSDNFFTKAQEEITSKMQARAAHLVAEEDEAPEQSGAGMPDAPKRAADSLRKAAQNLRRDSKRRKTG